MGISNTISSRRFPILQRIRLIKAELKGILYTRFGYKINVTEKEHFLIWYDQHLVDYNGYLIQEKPTELLAFYEIPEIGGIKVYLRKPPSSDFQVFYQIFVDHNFVPFVSHLLDYCNPKDINYIMDAGANVGLTTLYFKKHFPKAFLLSIEPDEGNFLQLKKNIAVNKLERVTPIRAGLWGKEENLEIVNTFRDRKEWAFQLVKPSENSNLKGYSVKWFMDMLSWDTIDILKLDIEGAEKFVFEDKQEAVKFLARVKFIVMEIHDEYPIREQIYTTLRENKFEFFEYGELTIGRNKNFLVS